MIKIYQIYKKFLNLFNQKEKNTEAQSEDSEYQLGISIKLSKEDNIDLFCELPRDIETLDKEQLVVLAEKYAELLVYMNNGLFANQIFDVLNDHSKTKDSVHLALFIDNIISFYDILNNELSKIKNQKSSKPLVRPISVFKYQ